MDTQALILDVVVVVLAALTAGVLIRSTLCALVRRLTDHEFRKLLKTLEREVAGRAADRATLEFDLTKSRGVIERLRTRQIRMAEAIHLKNSEVEDVRREARARELEFRQQVIESSFGAFQ